MTVTNHLDQPMLRGLFVPLTDEIDVAELAVTGAIPPDLDGAFIRNGPNPRFEPIGGYHMFDGDGMLHSVTLNNGKASYRNRWIETAALAAETRLGRALYGGLGGMHTPTREERGDAGRTKNPANTNIVRHAGRYLALFEGGPPTEVTADLATVGVLDYNGRIPGSFTAHPRVDPRTGEMFAFAYSPFPPHMQVFHFDPQGELTRVVNIDTPACSVMHDFAITATSLVFVDSPLLFDLAGVMAGGPPFRWDANHGTRVGIMARGGDTVRWFDVEDGYVNHFWNAWDDGDKIEFSGSRSPGTGYVESDSSGESGGTDAAPGLPTRFIIDLALGTATTETIDDLGGDFPHINDAYTGVRSRFHAMSAFRGTPDVIGHFDTVVVYDDQTGARAMWHAGNNTVVGDVVFAGAPNATAENDGWLMCTVHDRATGATDLAIIDATEVSKGPIARVHMPQRLPFGFHAQWFER